ncbi:MAG: T9SS type A sorting domain-containing protein [Bacteroidales bacterium]|nr:T9SS type A sorting domain-containing protein [Bacteroidales bacterium]
MKRIALLLTVIALLAGGFGVKVQAQDLSKRHVYFSEGFSGTGVRFDKKIWNLSADTGYQRLYYSTGAVTGGIPPEAIWGYVPSSGLTVVLRDTVRLVSKPFDLQADSRSYVSMKYKYQASKGSEDGARSFGLVARQPGGEWVPCSVISGGLPLSKGPEQLIAELPDALKNATAVEVSVFLQNRIDPVELKNTYMFYFDDIEFFAYPKAYYDLAFSWEGQPYVSVGEGDELSVQLGLENIGNTLNACKIAYTFDGGATRYLDLTFDEPLYPGQTHTASYFTPEGWAQAAEGHHTVVFWLAEANGVALSETAVSKQRKVLSKLNPATVKTYNYKPLVEEFSSSSCSACAPENKKLQPVFNELGDSISVLKYQMDFPGKGDPYYTGDGGMRKRFYNIQAVPSLYLNGDKDPGTGGTGGLLNRIREAINAPVYFDLAYDTLALDANENVYIALKVRASAPMDVVLQTTVLEGQTEKNAGTNGETSFYHVMLKMLPDANGVKISLKPDTVYTFRYAYSMKKTFMEEADDLKVICFLQAGDNTVLQSAIGDVKMRIDAAPVPGVANERSEMYALLSVYPNPASEEVLLPALDKATVEVFNMAGRRVFHQYGVQGDYRLDVRNFRPGIYVIKVMEENRTAWAKISVVR